VTGQKGNPVTTPNTGRSLASFVAHPARREATGDEGRPIAGSVYRWGVAIMTRVVLLALVVLGLGACAPAATRSGLTLPEAKALEHRLVIGMQADEVTALLGSNQRTRTAICGADRPATECVDWVYVFPATTTCGLVLGQFTCSRLPANFLVLRFERRAGDPWLLERWGWRVEREN
jgi:hypothetical protein